MAKINAFTTGGGGIQAIGDSSGTLELQTVNVSRLTIDSSGKVLAISPIGLGYGTGAGGTVTQATSKSTNVTLNKPCGRITMSNASLAGSTTVSFGVINSLLAQDDTVIVSIQNDTSAKYQATVSEVSANRFDISLRNITGVSQSDAVILNFAVIKGAIA